MVKKQNKKNKNSYLKIFFAGVIGGIIIFLIFGLKPSVKYDRAEVDTFTKCLTEKGAVMYGTFWCPKCAEVKKKFGESFRYMNYVECDPRGDNEQSLLCIEKGIEFYATFEFNNDSNSRIVGKPTFEELAERSGCTAPEAK